MKPAEDTIEREIATITADERRLAVSLSISFDGIEHVGRLWFAEEEWEDEGIPDRGTISGRTTEEVISAARALTEPELLARHRRATVNKRRYLSLRAVTDEILRKVRYLNQVAVSMRAGTHRSRRRGTGDRLHRASAARARCAAARCRRRRGAALIPANAQRVPARLTPYELILEPLERDDFPAIRAEGEQRGSGCAQARSVSAARPRRRRARRDGHGRCGSRESR